VPSRLEIIAIDGLPIVKEGDDVASLIGDAFFALGETPQDGDILVIAQKIISKAEGAIANLADIAPSIEAIELALNIDKDPRLVELILSQSNEVVKTRKGVLIVEHNLGYVHANAGIDRSNVTEDEEELALLLPTDPDGSARDVRLKIEEQFGVSLGVIINDSMGRAWRQGTIGHVIGSSGLQLLQDLKGVEDMFGRVMETTTVGVGDELAAAASFVMGQGAERLPVVLIRGAGYLVGADESHEILQRPKDEDLFR
jgi:coenzyme F420-0:L-glutamate ligase/coenzyme F420-1:gamma-L-glutamate ligase